MAILQRENLQKLGMSIKMAAPRFVNLSDEVINATEEIYLRRAQKMPLSLVKHLSKERYEVFADHIK